LTDLKKKEPWMFCFAFFPQSHRGEGGVRVNFLKKKKNGLATCWAGFSKTNKIR